MKAKYFARCMYCSKFIPENRDKVRIKEICPECAFEEKQRKLKETKRKKEAKENNSEFHGDPTWMMGDVYAL